MSAAIRVRFAPSPTGMFHVGGARSVDWLFLEQPPQDEASWAKAMKPGAEDILASVRKSWADADWTAETLRSGLEAAAAEHGLKLGKAQEPVRVAVSGRTIGLPLFESVELLGRERTVARIDAAVAKLTATGQEAQVPTP